MIEPFDTIWALLKISRDFFVRYFLPLHHDADAEVSGETDEEESRSPAEEPSVEVKEEGQFPDGGHVEQFSHPPEP